MICFSKNTICWTLFVFITSCIMYSCLIQTYFNSFFTDLQFFNFENFWSGSVALRHKATHCCFSITSCGFICSIHKIKCTLLYCFIWRIWILKTSCLCMTPHFTSFLFTPHKIWVYYLSNERSDWRGHLQLWFTSRLNPESSKTW